MDNQRAIELLKLRRDADEQEQRDTLAVLRQATYGDWFCETCWHHTSADGHYRDMALTELFGIVFCSQRCRDNFVPE